MDLDQRLKLLWYGLVVRGNADSEVGDHIAKCPKCGKVLYKKIFRLTSFNFIVCPSCGSRLRSVGNRGALIGGIGGFSGSIALFWLFWSGLSTPALVTFLLWVAFVLASPLALRVEPA